MDARDFFGYKNPDEEPGRPDPADDADGTRPPLFEEAVTLDDPSTLKRIDPDDMLGRVAELPRQLAQARRVAAPITRCIVRKGRTVNANRMIGTTSAASARRCLSEG